LLPPLGVAGIVVDPTEALHRLQDELIAAVAPYVAKTGTVAAFFSDEDGRDIQAPLIEYVADFVQVAAGTKFNPHVTIGVGTQDYLNAMPAEPFEPFTFSPAGGVPTWNIRHSPQGAQGVDVGAIRGADARGQGSGAG
jgi:hypothetical protein